MNNKDGISAFIETAGKIVLAVKYFLKKINNTDGSTDGNNCLPQRIEKSLPAESSGNQGDICFFKSSAEK